MDALLGQLPERAAVVMREALAHADWSAARRLAAQALTEVAWPCRPAPIPLARDLTPPQRALAQLLASRVGAHVPATFAIPQSSWNRRRWLGLDLPSPLEREVASAGEVVPFWRLAVPLARNTAALIELLRSLPLPDRLRAFRDLRMGAYTCSLDAPQAVAHALLEDDLGADARVWAPALADELLAMWVDDVTERGGLRVLVHELRFIAFLPLARAGVPIEPRWERLLPLNVGPWEGWMHECVSALPPARREAALEAALREGGDTDVLAIGLSLLAREPSAWLAREVLRCARADDRRSEARVLVEVEQVAARSPAVRRALDGYLANHASPPRLRVVDVARPRDLGEVPEGRRLQLAAADVGDVQAPDARLTIVELLEPTSGRSYVVFLHHVDTGVVFAGGTTEVVARVVQGGVECGDPTLGAALEVVLARLEAPHRARDR